MRNSCSASDGNGKRKGKRTDREGEEGDGMGNGEMGRKGGEGEMDGKVVGWWERVERKWSWDKSISDRERGDGKTRGGGVETASSGMREANHGCEEGKKRARECGGGVKEGR